MSRDINYNQLVGEVEEIELLLEEEEIPKAGIKKIKPKKKRFDDGTSVKQNVKKDKPQRFRKRD